MVSEFGISEIMVSANRVSTTSNLGTHNIRFKTCSETVSLPESNVGLGSTDFGRILSKLFRMLSACPSHDIFFLLCRCLLGPSEEISFFFFPCKSEFPFS